MDNSYLKEFSAKVEKVNSKFVVLDKTAFFPKGGGVENDTGLMIRKS
ncbi:MAG: alanine--tRNA ligase-related protein, partial [Candidatus Woesearchaeota archaeon]